MTNKPLDFTDKDKTVKIGITQRSLKFLTSLKKENHQFGILTNDLTLKVITFALVELTDGRELLANLPQ